MFSIHLNKIARIFVTQNMTMQTDGAADQAQRKTEKQYREEIEALNRQSNALNEQRIRIQTEIERAKKEKEEIEADLLAEFGTSDLAELSIVLASLEQKNEHALMDYKEGIRKLGEEIELVSSKLALIK